MQNNDNVIRIDFRRKLPAVHVPTPAAEYLPRARLPLLITSVYLVVSSVTFALCCCLASLALLFVRLP
jgi:hypothetical protein